MIRELSPADVRRFYDEGYLILKNLFSREEIAEMAAAAERLRVVGRELAEALSASGDDSAEQSAENRGAAPRLIETNGFALPGANSRPYFGAGTGVPVELFQRG